jgi:hypothetical protein
MPKTSSEGRRKTVSKASTLRLAPAGAGSSSNPDREDDDANEVHDEEVPAQKWGESTHAAARMTLEERPSTVRPGCRSCCPLASGCRRWLFGRQYRLDKTLRSARSLDSLPALIVLSCASVSLDVQGGAAVASKAIGLSKEEIRRMVLDKLRVVYRNWNCHDLPFCDLFGAPGERRDDPRAFVIALVAALLGGISEAMEQNNQMLRGARPELRRPASRRVQRQHRR